MWVLVDDVAIPYEEIVRLEESTLEPGTTLLLTKDSHVFGVDATLDVVVEALIGGLAESQDILDLTFDEESDTI